MNELKDKRIFIIEDDVTNMAVYTALLKQSGATVIRDFRNLDSVRLLVQHLPIDVILLDLMLRYRISGYEIYDELKTHPELAHIPVIAVSASDPELEIPRAKQKGFAGFISKPLNPRKFPQQIAACISGEHIWYTQHDRLEDSI